MATFTRSVTSSGAALLPNTVEVLLLDPSTTIACPSIAAAPSICWHSRYTSPALNHSPSRLHAAIFTPGNGIDFAPLQPSATHNLPQKQSFLLAGLPGWLNPSALFHRQTL